MHATTIVAWTAHAELLCPPCTDERYGPVEHDETGHELARLDGEGNEVAPVFASDTLEPGDTCGRCRELLGDA